MPYCGEAKIDAGLGRRNDYSDVVNDHHPSGLIRSVIKGGVERYLLERRQTFTHSNNALQIKDVPSFSVNGSHNIRFVHFHFAYDLCTCNDYPA